MATPLATLIEGKTSWGATPPTIEETDTGWLGKRWYLIEGRDLSLARNATRLPQRGNAWSREFPTLVVVNRRLVELAGVIDTASQYGGWSGCEVSYSTPTRGRLPVPVLNKKYSEWDTAQEAITRNFDVRNNPPAGTFFVEPPGSIVTPISQINNGKGVQVAVGTPRLLVHKWVQSAQIPITMMLKLHREQLVNRYAIDVPPMLDDTRQWRFEPGQLRYLDFKIAKDGDMVKLSHVLAAAPDFFYQWQPEDENGLPIGERTTNVVYAAADFTGLW